MYLMFSKSHDLPCLKVITKADFQRRINDVLNSDRPADEKARFEGALAAKCREASLNEQNKLTIPKDLCDRANLKAEHEVYLVGRNRHFEIWSPEHFQKVEEIENAMIGNDPFGVL